MKKKILFVLVMLVCLILISCGNKEPVVDDVYYEVSFLNNKGDVIEALSVKEGSKCEVPNFEIEEGFYYTIKEDISSLESVYEDLYFTLTKNEAFKTVSYLIDSVEVQKNTSYYTREISEPVPELKDKYESYSWELTDKHKDGNDYVFVYELKYEFKSTFTIRFFDGDEELNLGLDSYKKGTEAALPKYEKDGYYFVGWFLDSLSLCKYENITSDMEGDLVFYAKLVETVKHDKITLPDSKYHFINVRLNGNVYQPVFPSGSNSNVQSYDFTTSDPTVATISTWSSLSVISTGYCVVIATLKTDPTYQVTGIIKTTVDGVFFSNEEEANNIELCKVTFKDKDGNTMEEQTVQKGGFAYLPTPKTYEGLAFAGWDKDNYNITSDTVITATYVDGENRYVGKKISFIGDSISTFKNYIPEGYSCFYPYPTHDVNDVNQTWWMVVSNTLGTKLLVNNSYSGSCVASKTGKSASSTNERLATLKLSEQYADVIVIFMGSNDCAGVPVSDFDADYKVMIDKLKDLCPNAELLLCTLPQSKLYTNDNQKEFNAVIRKYANEYSLKLIELEDLSIVEYLIDSAHPGKEGMKVMGEKIVSEMLK